MKFFTSIWIVLITITVGVGLRVFDVDPLKILRLKTFDYYQKIQPRDVTSNHFIIVEVTEQDLKRFGQWPWSRSLIAEIHSKLVVQNVNTIQYNILFSEPDRLNPKSFTDNYKINEELKNELMKWPSNGQYLSQFLSVEGSKAVLMYSSRYSAKDGRVKKCKIMFEGSDRTHWM